MEYIVLDDNATLKKTSKFSVFDGPIPSINDDINQKSNNIDVFSIYNKIFLEFPSEKALHASLEERRASVQPEMKSSSMIYGELVDLQAMFNVFRNIIKCGNWGDLRSLHFCDIGSGTGRVSIGAALFSVHMQQNEQTRHDLIFNPCHGVEIMTSLFRIAERAEELYNLLSFEVPFCGLKPEVAFSLGSLLDLSVHNWTGCDVVFANSTCFDEFLMEEIGNIAYNMKPGSIIVTMSKTLPDSAGFDIVEEMREKTSWGSADFFIQRRRIGT